MQKSRRKKRPPKRVPRNRLPQIIALYELLLRMSDNPIVRPSSTQASDASLV